MAETNQTPLWLDRDLLREISVEFEGRYVLTKQMVADYYEVDERTIERFLEANKEELEHNGYFLYKGNSLKEFKLRFASDIDVATKTTVLGLLYARGKRHHSCW